MGLAGPRKRTKIASDPNNTAWTRSTTSFGHRTLIAQGWTPGEFLGPKDAPHADLHSAASQSHIRVVLKDDNLGLGAKQGNDATERQFPGLDAFQGLLGRLNGRSEAELSLEQKYRDDQKRSMYLEQRLGLISFVRGGLLVGDRPEVSAETANSQRATEKANEHDSALLDQQAIGQGKRSKPVKKARKSHKAEKPEVSDSKSTNIDSRQGSRIGDNGTEALDMRVPKHANDLPHMKKTAKGANPDNSSNQKAVKRHKAPKEKKPKTVSVGPQLIAKEQKREKKLERRARKEARRVENQASNSTDPMTDLRQEHETAATVVPVAKDIVSTSSQTTLKGGRYAARQRNIQQKQRAIMDVSSLNEIFMIKAG